MSTNETGQAPPTTEKSTPTPSPSSTPTPSSPSPTPPQTSSTPSSTPTPSSPSSTPKAPATSSTPDHTSSPEPTSSQDSPSPSPTSESSNIVTVTPSGPVTSVVVVTSTRQPSSNDNPIPTITSSTPTATPIPAGDNSGSGGLSQTSKVAIGVVVPIAAIAILAVVALFWWKKRRARREAEEERRKEVEDYAYNPNADPTIPAVGLAADNSYEMREDGSAGYRGWGTTVGGSTGRKASTTMSGGVTNAYSDPRSNVSEARSGEALLDGSHSPEGEILGAMGPSAANNRGDVRRGPSNASSSYSAAGRSDGSDGGMGVAYGGGPYYEQYGQNPYGDNGYGGQNGEVPPQPIIRDNPARRNTRIENPSHYPQQSAGIAQNF